jgi:hypothetical protein
MKRIGHKVKTYNPENMYMQFCLLNSYSSRGAYIASMRIHGINIHIEYRDGFCGVITIMDKAYEFDIRKIGSNVKRKNKESTWR